LEILEALESPKGIGDWMDALGINERRFFTRKYVQMFLDAGLIQPEHPEPRHPRQRYLLTDAGKRLLEARSREDGE
jgi:predicted transcriptional regulator